MSAIISQSVVSFFSCEDELLLGMVEVEGVGMVSVLLLFRLLFIDSDDWVLGIICIDAFPEDSELVIFIESTYLFLTSI